MYGMKLFIHSQTSTVAPLKFGNVLSNFVLYFTGCVITYPCWDWSQSTLVMGAPDIDLSTHPSALENSWQSTQGPELVLVSTWPLTGITFIDSGVWWRQLFQPYCQI